MAQDTIIVLCKTLNEAMIASSQIERKHDLNRLFIFLGKRPGRNELSWMAPTDSSFCLERALEWGSEPELLGIRAGLMFASGWDLLFCWASNCPSPQDIEWIRKELKTEGVAKLSNVWGITRDHYILKGLGESTPTISSEQVKKVDSISDGLLLAEALAGNPVELKVALAALKEVVPVTSMAVHNSAIKSDCKPVVDAIANLASFIDEDSPVCILAGEINEDELNVLRTKLPNNGAVIQITKTITLKPYRTISTKDGVKIGLYGKPVTQVQQNPQE